MKILRHSLAVLTFLTINVTTAKQTGTRQPYQERIIQPQQPQQKQPIIEQPIIQQPSILNEMTYDEIYTELKKKQPQSQNFTSLNNIKNEAQKQINLIQKKPTQQQPIGTITDIKLTYDVPMLRQSAANLIETYKIPFKVVKLSPQQKNGTADIFTDQQYSQQVASINNIVRKFKQLHQDVDQITGVATILSQIQQNQDLKGITEQLTTDANYKLINDIEDIINRAWRIKNNF